MRNDKAAQQKLMNWEYEAKRNAALLNAVTERLKSLEGYSLENDFHRGVRIAVLSIRADLKLASRRFPKSSGQKGNSQTDAP